jgi:hypothetical protein
MCLATVPEGQSEILVEYGAPGDNRFWKGWRQHVYCAPSANKTAVCGIYLGRRPFIVRQLTKSDSDRKSRNLGSGRGGVEGCGKLWWEAVPASSVISHLAGQFLGSRLLGLAVPDRHVRRSSRESQPCDRKRPRIRSRGTTSTSLIRNPVASVPVFHLRPDLL